MIRCLALAVAVLSFFATRLSAQELYIVGQNRKAPVAVSIRIAADFIAVPLTVAAERKDDKPVAEADRGPLVETEREAARKMYEAVIAKKGRLSAVIVGFEKQPYLYLTYPITSRDKLLSAYLKEIDEAYKTVFSQGKSKCTLGSPVLALSDVDKYRQQLIGMICYDAQKLTESLGDGLQVTISGLESPVTVSPVGNYDVDVFIRYGMSVETTKLSSQKGPSPDVTVTRDVKLDAKPVTDTEKKGAAK